MPILASILAGFWEIIKAPFLKASTWWILAPIFLLWFTLEFYFGEYKKESLGWNTSLANGVSLVWIGLLAMRHLFEVKETGFIAKFIAIVLITVYGLFIVYISFTHKFTPKVVYTLASPTPIYFMSIVVVLWAFDQLKMRGWIIFDLVIFFILNMVFFMIIRKLLPTKEEKPTTEEAAPPI